MKMGGARQRGSGRGSRRRDGSAGCASEAAAEVELPEGPRSLQEVLDFPDLTWQRLFTGSAAAEDRLLRLIDVLKRGVHLSSQYSGKGTAETAAAHLAKKFSEEGLEQQLPGPWLNVASAFDIKPFARDTLKGHTGISRPSCVFADMHVCMNMRARAHLSGMAPEKSASPDVRAAAHECMLAHVKEHAVDMFPANQKGQCFIHGGLDGCEVFPKKDKSQFLAHVCGRPGVQRRFTERNPPGVCRSECRSIHSMAWHGSSETA